MSANDEASAKSKAQQQPPTLRDEVLGWLLLYMTHHPSLLEKKIEWARLIGDPTQGAMAKLERKGCSRNVLLTTLALASGLHELYPPINAEDLRNLATQIKVILQEMNRLIPQVLIATGKPNVDLSADIEFGPAAGDLQLQPSLERALNDKIYMYEALADLCTTNRVPDRATMRSVARLLPLVYVIAKTGVTNYADVAHLMQCADFDKVSPNGLRAAYLSFKAKNPEVLQWLERALVRFLTIEAEGKDNVIVAYLSVDE